MAEQRTVHGQVLGRVQGVAYRASFRHEALALGLEGWVRNRTDGSVEFLVQGDADVVDRILEWARRGPALARVDKVRSREVDGADVAGFEIRA